MKMTVDNSEIASSSWVEAALGLRGGSRNRRPSALVAVVEAPVVDRCFDSSSGSLNRSSNNPIIKSHTGKGGVALD